MAGLNKKELIELAVLYDYPEFRTFKKMLDIERLETAKKLAVWPADDTLGITRLQSYISACKQIYKQLKDINAKVSKER